MRPRLLALEATLVLVAVLAPLITANTVQAAPASPGPPLEVPETKLAAALSCPNGFHHPEHRAVLLVHGTSVTAEENWGWTYMKALPAAGYDACTVEQPDYAFVDIQISAEYVVYAIREVARRSHGRITSIGLSQGGIEPRWALKWWPDIHNLVASYVAMATPNHGGPFGTADCAYSCVPSVWQQGIPTSQLLTALNRGTEVPYIGSVAYTSVYSLTDDIIQPAFPNPTAALAGASNIAVQDICPGRYVGHIQSAWDAAYYAVVMDALSHPGPADPNRVDRSYCNQQAMPGVDPTQAWPMTAEFYVLAGERQTIYPGRTTSEPSQRCYASIQGCPPLPSAEPIAGVPAGVGFGVGLPTTAIDRGDHDCRFGILLASLLIVVAMAARIGFRGA